MTVNRKSAQGRPLMPPTQMITVVTAAGGGAVIDTVADTTILTLAELIATHGPVLVTASVNLVIISGEITFKLFRDGAEVDTNWRYYADLPRVTSGKNVVTVHWVDETPGASPTYSLRAIAAAANNRYEAGSRLSAML